MTRSQALRVAALLALSAAAALGTACAHVDQLDAQLHQLQGVASQARTRGAYRCAPEELAEAEAQLEFAAGELREGDPTRAREHLILAQANANAALRLSAGPACTPRSYAPEAVRAQPSITAQRTLRCGSTKEHAAI